MIHDTEKLQKLPVAYKNKSKSFLYKLYIIAHVINVITKAYAIYTLIAAIFSLFLSIFTSCE